MAVVAGLIQAGDACLCFGNYELDQKSKVSDFPYQGDLYKVKTFREITKLERNGLFVYESVPGTAVFGLSLDAEGMRFTVEGEADAQITVELEPETSYVVVIDGTSSEKMKTNLGGKLSFSVELSEAPVRVEVKRA